MILSVPDVEMASAGHELGGNSGGRRDLVSHHFTCVFQRLFSPF